MSTQSGQAPAGWYDDGSGRLRWWDGTGWTEWFADSLPVVQPAVVPSAGPPARRRRVWPWVVGGVAVLLAVGGGMTPFVLGAISPHYPNTAPLDVNGFHQLMLSGHDGAAYSDIDWDRWDDDPVEQLNCRDNAAEISRLPLRSGAFAYTETRSAMDSAPSLGNGADVSARLFATSSDAEYYAEWITQEIERCSAADDGVEPAVSGYTKEDDGLLWWSSDALGNYVYDGKVAGLIVRDNVVIVAESGFEGSEDQTAAFFDSLNAAY